VNGQVLLLLEQLDKGTLQPGIDVPIHAAQVVALGIVPVVGKLDRGAAPGGAPLARDLPSADATGDQGELL